MDNLSPIHCAEKPDGYRDQLEKSGRRKVEATQRNEFLVWLLQLEIRCGKLSVWFRDPFRDVSERKLAILLLFPAELAGQSV